MILWILPACQPELQPPSCTDDSEFACFSGVFRTLLGAPVESVEVCAPEHPELDCVQTDSEGAWKLPGLPLDTNVFLTATHPDYVPSLFPQHTSMDWYDWYKVAIPTAIMNSNANRLDVELDPEKGQLLFLTWEGLNIDGVDTENIPDVTATTNEDVQYLFYGDSLGLASANLSHTSSAGSGGVLNLEPGELSLRLQSPAGSCAEEHMFHFTVDEWIPIPIRSGFTTAIDVICPID